MVESLILLEGSNLNRNTLEAVSLRNAKHLVVNVNLCRGHVVHIEATTFDDLGNALTLFMQLPDVRCFTTLIICDRSEDSHCHDAVAEVNTNPENMPVTVEYPVEICAYLIDRIDNREARLLLFNIENKVVGEVSFLIDLSAIEEPHAIINRGGWLTIRLSISLFSAVIALLRGGSKVLLSADGLFEAV